MSQTIEGSTSTKLITETNTGENICNAHSNLRFEIISDA